jgi:hypothetical protein
LFGGLPDRSRRVRKRILIGRKIGARSAFAY